MSDPRYSHEFVPSRKGLCKQIIGAEICHQPQEAPVHNRPPKLGTAEQWAEEGIRKYGADAVAWLRRWKVNCQGHPADLAELDKAIEIVKGRHD